MTDKQKQHLKNIFNYMFDIHQYKLQYALATGILLGAYLCIKNYGFKYSPESFDIFEEVLNARLSGTPDIEYEYSETVYAQLMRIKNKAIG